MSESKKPREFWINPLDIPKPDSFAITGAVVSGDNPQNGEVLFREVTSDDKLARAEALMAKMQWVIENYIMYADAYPEDAGDALRALAQYRGEK